MSALARFIFCYKCRLLTDQATVVEIDTIFACVINGSEFRLPTATATASIAATVVSWRVNRLLVVLNLWHELLLLWIVCGLLIVVRAITVCLALATAVVVALLIIADRATSDAAN